MDDRLRDPPPRRDDTFERRFGRRRRPAGSATGFPVVGAGSDEIRAGAEEILRPGRRGRHGAQTLPVRAPGRLVPVGAVRGCRSLRYGAGAGRRPHPAPSTVCQLARTAGVTSRAEAAWGRAHRSRTAPCRSSSTAVATLAGRERGARTGLQCRSHVTACASWRRAAATGRELRTRAPPRLPIAPPTTMCQLARTAGATCKPETERAIERRLAPFVDDRGRHFATRGDGDAPAAARQPGPPVGAT
jgi:hypothetical protein